jgi:hypothetical protein
MIEGGFYLTDRLTSASTDEAQKFPRIKPNINIMDEPEKAKS